MASAVPIPAKGDNFDLVGRIGPSARERDLEVALLPFAELAETIAADTDPTSLYRVRASDLRHARDLLRPAQLRGLIGGEA